MELKEIIRLSKETKRISNETGRDFKEVLAEITPKAPKKSVKLLDTSKGVPMTKKEIKKIEFAHTYKPREIKDIHEYNLANAKKNLPSSMR